MKIKNYFVWAFAIMTVVLLIANAQRAIIYSKDALNICFEMIVPTLFPFFICSGLLIYSGFSEVMARAFRFLMYPLFKVAPAGSGAFVLGIVSGYPLGAVTAGELYQNNYLSKSEAERLLAFCNNSGPLFILGSVGIAVYSDMRAGIAMYVSHILAAVTVGIIFRFYGRKKHSSPPTRMTSPQRSIGEIFSISLSNGISSMLTVCGAVLFFSVASRLMLDLVPLEGALKPVVSGIFEFVTGTVGIAVLDASMAQKLILTAGIVGFAGISVHVQVMAVIARYNLSLVPYIIGKALHGVISALYMGIYLRFFPITTAVFNPSMSRGAAAASAFELITAAAVITSFLIYAISRYLKVRKYSAQ